MLNFLRIVSLFFIPFFLLFLLTLHLPLLLLWQATTRQGTKHFPAPPWEINGPTNRRATFLWRQAKQAEFWTERNGTERWRRVVIKIFILKRLSECFRLTAAVCCLAAWWKRSWQCEWVSYNNRKNRRNWQQEEQQQNEATAKSENVMLGSDLYRWRWDERRKELRLSTWVYIPSEEGRRERKEGEESEESAENEGIERGEKPFCKCSKRKHNIYAMAEHVCVRGRD